MPYVLVVIVLGLAQCAAAVSGLIEFGLHPILAIVLGGALLTFVAPLLVVPGVYGAVVAWHWHWFWAIALFCPTLILMFTMTGVFSAWSLLQGVANRRSTSDNDAGTIRCGKDAVRDADLTQRLASTNVGAWDGRTTARASSQWIRVAIPVLVIGAIVAVVSVLKPETGLPEASRIAIPPAAAVPSSSKDSTALSPSFDCRVPSNAAEFAVCQNGALAALDRKMAGLFASLLLESRAQDDLQIDQLQWSNRVRDACTTIECLDTAYRTRIESLQIAATASEMTVSGVPMNTTAEKQNLLHWSERAPELAKNSGAQDYFYRLCGMSTEADELRQRIQETSMLYYEYGRYVLDVELSSIRQVMDNFAVGEREARMELNQAGGPASLACTSDVMRAARARYDVDRNAIGYRPDLLAAMATAVAQAKRAREAGSKPSEKVPEDGSAQPGFRNNYSPLWSGAAFGPTTGNLKFLVDDPPPLLR